MKRGDSCSELLFNKMIVNSKRSQTNILVSILLIAIFIVAFAIVFLVVRGVLIEKSKGIGSDYGSFLKMLFERDNSSVDVISGPGANTNNFGNNIYGSGDYINCSGGSGDYINCSDKSGEIIVLGPPGNIKCFGVTHSVSDVTKACCSPADCGGNICNETIHQCTSINPCNGTGTFQKCFGYVTTIQLNASNRDNIYWVWDALFVNNKIGAKGGDGTRNVSRTDIENYSYCYLTGHLAGEYRYHYGSPNDFYVPFRFDSTVPGRFCTVNITNTFCIGSSPGYNFVPGTYPKPGSVNPYTRIPPLGINYTVAGDYINVYSICDGCTQDSHCPNTGNPCTYYACSNNKCVLRSNITACTVNPIVENCTILGVANKVYNLSSTFKVDKVVEGEGCLVVTAPNVILNCNGNSMINSSFPATAIFSDQIGTIIKNCRINAGGWAAIGLRNTAKNSLIFNNTIYNNPTAISIDLGPDTSIIIDSNNLSNNAHGIYHSLENGWTGEPADTYNVIKNNIIDNNDLGIFAHGSSETIKLNYIRKNSGGIYAAGKNNIITNNVIENNLGQGIHISAGLAGGTPYADTWINNVINGNRICENSVYASGGAGQVSLFEDNQCSSSNAGTCSWNCSSSCVDTDGGNNENLSGVTAFGGVSYIDKCINSSTLKEYYCSSSTNINCPFGCLDGACINPFGNIKNIAECSILNISNTEYRLVTSLVNENVIPVSPTGCIDIQASNITFNCNGFAIMASSLSIRGVYSNQNYTTIKNCNISMNSGYAVGLNGTINAFVLNSTLNSNYRGIYAENIQKSKFENITANSNYYGIYLISSFNNTLKGIVANSNLYGGITILGSYNQLSNIVANSNMLGECLGINQCAGIIIGGSYNLLNNISANSNVHGIFLYYGSGNIINNVTATSNQDGIYFYGSENNILNKINLKSNGEGIYLYSSGANMLQQIDVTSSNYGIYVDASDINTLTQINATSNLNGVYLQHSSYTGLNNNTLCGNGLDFGCSTTGTASSGTYGNGNKIGVFTKCPSNNWPSGSDYSPCSTGISSCQELSADPNVYYKLTNNLVITGSGMGYCITITGKNTTIDCQGYSITPDASTYRGGIYSNQNDTTIKNCIINGTRSGGGIVLEGSSGSLIFNNSLLNDANAALYVQGNNNSNVGIINNTLRGGYGGIIFYSEGTKNSVVDNNIIEYVSGNGIYLYGGDYINITNNRLNSNDYGIYLRSSSNNILKNNNMSSNTSVNFYFYGSSNEHFNNTIDLTNTINSKRIYYNFSISNYQYDLTSAPLAGMLVCALCNNITVKNLNLSNGYLGVYLFNTTNSTIKNVTANSNSAYGVYFSSSSNNNLTGITANSNNYGIYLYNSNYNFLNKLTTSLGYSPYEYGETYGTYLYSSSNNILNNITSNSNSYGTYLYSSSNNNLTGITANSNNYGIYLYNSNYNFLNKLTTNLSYSSFDEWMYEYIGGYGVYLYSSSNNILNNIISNSNELGGIYLYTASSNNVLTNIMANSNSGNGIILSSLQDYEIYPPEYITFPGLNNSLNNITSSSNNAAGLLLHGESNTRLNNISVNSNNNGVLLELSTNNILSNIKASSNYYSGVILQSSLNTSLNNNTICGNTYYDFSCSDSNYTSGKGNKMNLTSVCSNPTWPSGSDYTTCGSFGTLSFWQGIKEIFKNLL